MPRRSTAVAVTCLLAASLVGCTPPPTAPPTPTSTAIFASEEEALAAATDVLTRYNAAFDKANSAGAKNWDELEELVTQQHLTELEKPGVINSNGWHTKGVSTFSVVSVASFESGESDSSIALNVCRDVSGVRVLDASGQDVTPINRPDSVPLVVSLVTSDSEPSSLLVAKVDTWLNPASC
ncbi:hypothetical protein GCM10008097_20370 [Mycetocola manganoxydans]|nr:hypothetical protein GCM10008097_20370 [Mycetocola manganoxydans]